MWKCKLDGEDAAESVREAGSKTRPDHISALTRTVEYLL